MPGHGTARGPHRAVALLIVAACALLGTSASAGPSPFVATGDTGGTALPPVAGGAAPAEPGRGPRVPASPPQGSGPAWAASIARTMPADLHVPAAPGPGDRCAPAGGQGWLAAENRRPGNPLPVHGADFPGGSVQAVPATAAAACGDTVDVAINAPPGQYVLRAWRVGWYGGAGGRITWTSPPFTAGHQAVGDARDAIGGGPGWRPTTRLTITPQWLSGLYLVEVRAVGRAATGWFPLSVRGGWAHASRSPAAYVVPTLTWAAYNPYGGASLYRAMSGPPTTAVARRARVVALGRPLEMQGQRQVVQYTVPLVQTMEEAGVDVDYLADTDVDAAPGLLAGRAEVVVGSHAEYATTRMYDALEAARNGGTNLAFLGANQVYWHVLLVRDARGVPQAVRLHRVLAEDPARTSAPADATVRWRDAPLRRPEAALLGAQYRGLGVVSPLLPLDPPAWTGWTAGQPLPAAASGEVDAMIPAGPPGVQALAQGTTRRGKGWVDAAATYYVAPSGAAVVDTGSIDTGCLSRGECYQLDVPPVTRAAVHDLVVRVVTGFATPRFGTAHPAAPAPGGYLAGAALAARYGRAVTGSAVGGDDD